MTGQNLFLIMVLVAFGTFAVTLGGVSAWLWTGPRDEPLAPEQAHAAGRHRGEAVDDQIAA
jgi:hypothetical protein